MLMPKRPPEMSLIVIAMRATIAGCKVRVATEAYSWIFSVTAANPAMSVNDSKL